MPNHLDAIQQMLDAADDIQKWNYGDGDTVEVSHIDNLTRAMPGVKLALETITGRDGSLDSVRCEEDHLGIFRRGYEAARRDAITIVPRSWLDDRLKKYQGQKGVDMSQLQSLFMVIREEIQRLEVPVDLRSPPQDREEGQA